MAKKNKESLQRGISEVSFVSKSTTELAPIKPPKSRDLKPSTSALIICRNKHWRYISSFHGPWLQLPPEVLESLANNNYNLPRPRPIDPAVFFDLLKIRKLVDDATNLAVRAASGVTSSSLQSSLNAGNGLLGNTGTALGIGLGGGANAKLSRERKYRMRERATQKLSKAYYLDEIACSVATMQSASSLEDVAELVLQRSPLDADARYVHFFHEKIPSRQLAECTSLQPLDEVIAERPGDGEPLRTRAVTKIFKEDYLGAVQDLTAALQLCRYQRGQHRADRQQLQLASVAATEKQRNSRWKDGFKPGEKDNPSSLETQLLFQRAAVYLTIAFQHVNAALLAKPRYKVSDGVNGQNGQNDESIVESAESSPAEKKAELKRLEARKIVKINAKRALRDYIAYLSHFDYTPGLPTEITEEFVRKVNQAANRFKSPRAQQHSRVLEMDSNTSLGNGQYSDALVSHIGAHCNPFRDLNSSPTDLTSLPSPVVYQISALFSAAPPRDLSPYPDTRTSIATQQNIGTSPPNQTSQALLAYARAERHEALTYHPLLTDALHSLLLCHCLMQTSARELQRHAFMAARLVRLCDGYPIFQAARSPSRADWIEIVRRTDNWIALPQSWEVLCAPAPMPGQLVGGGAAAQQKETAEQRRERLRQQAIMEALEDDRVHDEASFYAAVQARQRRQQEEELNGGVSSKRWMQEDGGREYPIGTERAEAIVRWILEAPLGNEVAGWASSSSSSSRKKKKKVSEAGPKKEDAKLNDEMNGLKVGDGEGETCENVEEEEAD